MKHLLLSAFILLFFDFSAFSQNNHSPLVHAEWLQNNLDRDDLVLFHIGNKEQYQKEHIPGAVFMDGSEYTITAEDRSYIYDLPSVEELVELLEKKGLNDGDTVVLYVGSNWVSPMTRLYFTLDYLGYSNHTFILDGGLPLWKSRGGAVTDAVPEPGQGSFTPNINPDIVTDINFVKSKVNTSGYHIADARSPVYYQGIEEGMGGKKGHLPSAKTIPYTSMIKEGPHGAYTFLNNSELQAVFNEQEINQDIPLILYCHIGQQATTVYFAAKKLGYNVKVFDGSFHEWATKDNPVVLEN